MSKGVAKRIIVAEPPDPALFERTVFVLRDEAFLKDGANPEALVREAGEIADAYIREKRQERRKRPRPWVWALSGAGATAAAAAALWLLLG